MNEKEITELARQIRLETLKSLTQLGFGHYGGSMSVVETLAVLYGAVMKSRPGGPGLAGARLFCAVKMAMRAPSALQHTGDQGLLSDRRAEHAQPERDAPAEPPGPSENARRRCYHRFAGTGDFHRRRHGAVAQAGRAAESGLLHRRRRRAERGVSAGKRSSLLPTIA